MAKAPQAEPGRRESMLKPKDDLSCEFVRSLLSYNSEDGTLRWRLAPNGRVEIGQIAGSVQSHGYRHIQINGRIYKAHRLAWLCATGKWPESMIDHVNGDRDDNRICNLRCATKSQNSRNAKRYSSNQSGFKGVHWNSGHQKWNAAICFGGKQHNLGYYDSANKAYTAYCAASQKFHGEFGRLA